MDFDVSFTEDDITLVASQKRPGILGRLISQAPAKDLGHLPQEDRALIFALADLRALADTQAAELAISPTKIVMPHRLAAALDSATAEILGLPPVVDLVFRTDAEGIIGSSNFRLRHEWFKNGQRQMPKRTGAILHTAAGLRRLPLWLLEAVEVAENHEPGRGDAADWEALARFRKSLDPGVSHDASYYARVSMTDFLSGLEVRLADRFSISPRGETDFDVVPFSGQRLSANGHDTDDGNISEEMGELQDADLQTFQTRLRQRGALPAFRLSPGSYLVIDQSSAPALAVMAEMQHAEPAERAAFIRNPTPRLTEAVETSLREKGKLSGLSPQAEQELIENTVGPMLIETKEFSERVTGVIAFEKMAIDVMESSGTTWLPEDFSRRIVEALATMPKADLESLRAKVASAIDEQLPSVSIANIDLPARPDTLKLIDDKLAQADGSLETVANDEPPAKHGPIVLESEVNFEELNWHAKLRPRLPLMGDEVPANVRTPLKPYQRESLTGQINAWKAGLPGILNADEQGLGKTLQTIAFIAWLKANMAKPEATNRGPVLVVAPTSLLENWEQEVSRHMVEPGLGHLIRLYGSSLGGRRLTGAKGRDTDNGEAKLDLNTVHEAIEEGRAHRFWMLTTYTTLTNYQHSLGRIPFSAVVFDEIQALKNPISLRAVAARAINADFRIGLTGTPIENSTVDLWAIMDQLAAGSLDSLKDFRERYGTPDAANMAELHSRVFRSNGANPPLAFRRLKETVASDLPKKSRKIHPRLMPDIQALAYDDARLKLATGGLGAQLKMLHHIRSVSVHPALDVAQSDAEFIATSGRLNGAIDILRDIKARGERVLVFIEHRKMQYRFIELVRSEFGLARVDLINGDTPIQQRQAIVNRFQRHQELDGGFDMLVLGPKAAGTGLTLTAATHVIHLSRWWNPAVEEQCNDRVHRLGQTRPVTVHVPMAVHSGYREQSFDCLLHSLMMRKRRLASSALWPMADTEDDLAQLQKMMVAEKTGIVSEPLREAMEAMFARDRMELPPSSSDGSIEFA